MTQWGIETLFNPGKRHVDEEKRRLQATREEVGDSSGGRRIDLESGTVRIARPRPKADGGGPDDEHASDEAGSDEAGSDDAGSDDALIAGALPDTGDDVAP